MSRGRAITYTGEVFDNTVYRRQSTKASKASKKSHESAWAKWIAEQNLAERMASGKDYVVSWGRSNLEKEHLEEIKEQKETRDKIVQALKDSDPGLRHLDLSHSAFTKCESHYDVGRIELSLRTNHTLVSLNLADCNLGFQGALCIVKALSSCGLAELYLGNNSIGKDLTGDNAEQDFASFARSLKALSGLETVSLKMNDLQTDMIEILVEDCLDGHPSLTRMDIYHNPSKEEFDVWRKTPSFKWYRQTLARNQKAKEAKNLVNIGIKFQIDLNAAAFGFGVYVIDVATSIIFYTQEIQGVAFRKSKMHVYVQPLSFLLIWVNVLLLIWATLRINMSKAAARNYGTGGARQKPDVIDLLRLLEVKKLEMKLAYLDQQYAVARVLLEDLPDITQVLIVAYATQAQNPSRSPVFMINLSISVVLSLMFVLSHVRTRSVKAQRQNTVANLKQEAKYRAIFANRFGAGLEASEQTNEFDTDLDGTMDYLFSFHCMLLTTVVELGRLWSYLQALFCFEQEPVQFNDVMALPWKLDFSNWDREQWEKDMRRIRTTHEEFIEYIDYREVSRDPELVARMQGAKNRRGVRDLTEEDIRHFFGENIDSRWTISKYIGCGGVIYYPSAEGKLSDDNDKRNINNSKSSNMTKSVGDGCTRCATHRALSVAGVEKGAPVQKVEEHCASRTMAHATNPLAKNQIFKVKAGVAVQSRVTNPLSDKTTIDQVQKPKEAAHSVGGSADAANPLSEAATGHVGSSAAETPLRVRFEI
jgi:hypothetical protein